MNSKLVVLFSAIIISLVSGCGYLGQQAPQPYFTGNTGGMPMYGAPGMMGAPQVMAGPPNMAVLGAPARGCTAGPLAVDIRNETGSSSNPEGGQYIELQMDSQDLILTDQLGRQLPAIIPPQTSAFVCLTSLGQHMFTGTRYVGRVGRFVEVGKINFVVNFGTNVGGRGNHAIFISDAGVTTS